MQSGSDYDKDSPAAVAVRSRQFDPHVAHPARVYSVWIGGKDHYPADRRAAEEVAACRPQVVAGARANRAFLVRAVRYLAGPCGIRQFVDIGPGLPAPGATHTVAQAIAPECRIVHVDNDPLVLAHARALLTSTTEGACDYIDADLRDPEVILKEASHTLDLTQPTAVLLVAVLHFLTDADDPRGVVATLADALAPGSFVAISHLTGDFAPSQVASGVAAYNALVPARITARSHAELTALFGGLPLVAPGIIPVAEWQPDRIARLCRRHVRRARHDYRTAPLNRLIVPRRGSRTGDWMQSATSSNAEPLALRRHRRGDRRRA